MFKAMLLVLTTRVTAPFEALDSTPRNLQQASSLEALDRWGAFVASAGVDVWLRMLSPVPSAEDIRISMV